MLLYKNFKKICFQFSYNNTITLFIFLLHLLEKTDEPMLRLVLGRSDGLEAGSTRKVHFLFACISLTILSTFCCTGMFSLSDAFPSNTTSSIVAMSMSVSKKLTVNKKYIIINVNK